MERKHNSTKDGNSWTDETKKLVWAKGEKNPEYNESVWRWDKCGLVMKWSEHGNRNSENGWEIDHINPVANGDGDELSNLQPLNWNNNSDKAVELNWICPKRS